MYPKVKICGLCRTEDIEAVNEYKADYAGFVFFEKSKRCISYESAERLCAKLSPSVTSVGVCVSPTAEKIRRMEECGLDLIQVHGTLRRGVIECCRLPIWQAINISGCGSFSEIIYHPRVRGYVIDGAAYGGGKTFGWDGDEYTARRAAGEIRERIGDKTLVLAGGLDDRNVGKGIKFFSPDIVDVSSGVEEEGKKCRDKIRIFIEAARENTSRERI